MLQKAKLSTYLDGNPVVWVHDMPNDVPPEKICVLQEHVLYRLTKEEIATEEDLTTIQNVA